MRYLSDEWLAEADRAVATLDPAPDGGRVGFAVSGGPDGLRAYSLVLGPTEVGVDPTAEGAQLTFHLEWPLAVAIAKGTASAQRAMLDGHLRIDGDVGVLLSNAATLAGIDDVLATLRSTTTF